MNSLRKILKATKNYFFSKRFLIFLSVLGVGIIISYALLVVYAKKVETLITFPGTNVNLKEFTNHPAGLVAAEEYFVSYDEDKQIHGIYVDRNAEKTVYYFHGNGAPIEYFYDDVRYIADLGFNVMAYDYPGYGKSDGRPYEEEVSLASEVFFKYMTQEKNISNEDIIVWGYSVGTAVAVEFAKDKDFDSLVLMSALASRYDMSEKNFGFPVQKLFFLPNSYVSYENIKQIDEPTLMIHGNTDRVVPFSQGKKVFDSSLASKKQFIEIDDFGHSLITERYGDVLEVYIQDFLQNDDSPGSYIFLDRESGTQILREIQEAKFLASFDLESDTSIQKYVDPSVSFRKLGYIPEDLNSLGSEYITDTKGNALMREEAVGALESMAEAFYEEIGEKMVVVSTYRSYSYQAGIKARGCPDTLCAKAGYSEHQSGLAVDFWSASTKETWDASTRLTSYYNWLSENAHTYGYHNPYQNGPEVDGYAIEPWHWRYLGTSLSSYLHSENITFSEFYYSLQEGEV